MKKQKSSENSQILVKLIQAIANEDQNEAMKIIMTSPDVVHQSLVSGATRQSAVEYYYRNIRHYLVAGDTALHAAAAGYQIALVNVLTRNGADVRAKDRRGAEPLHYAADSGSVLWNLNHKAQIETIRALLGAGADPNAVNKDGVAPLHRAVRQRCPGAVDILLRNGANVNLKNGNGSTPFHLAVQYTGRGGTGAPEVRSLQKEIIRLLLNAGANLSETNSKGKTILNSVRSKWISDYISSFRL